MLLRIRHVTTYRYAHPVSVCHNIAHLEPRGDGPQRLLAHELRIDPAPELLQRGRDYFGNGVAHFTISSPHECMTVEATSRVEVTGPTPAPIDVSPWTASRDALRRDPAALDALQFAFDSPYVQTADELADYAKPSFPGGRSLRDGCRDLCARIHREFRYDPLATTIATPTADVLRDRQGVCQDFAHLMIGSLRSLGLAARYVSGYLVTRPPAGAARLVGADASHAWVSVYVPGDGFRDFDPTNGCEPTTDYATLAWGRDYGDVSPVKGVLLGGGEHRVSVGVDVISE